MEPGNVCSGTYCTPVSPRDGRFVVMGLGSGGAHYFTVNTAARVCVCQQLMTHWGLCSFDWSFCTREQTSVYFNITEEPGVGLAACFDFFISLLAACFSL